MTITIENPTPEAFYQAARQIMSADDLRKLGELLCDDERPESPEAESQAWYAASHQAASNFFEEEEKR